MDPFALGAKYLLNNYYQTSIVTDVKERKSVVNPSTNSAKQTIDCCDAKRKNLKLRKRLKPFASQRGLVGLQTNAEVLTAGR